MGRASSDTAAAEDGGHVDGSRGRKTGTDTSCHSGAGVSQARGTSDSGPITGKGKGDMKNEKEMRAMNEAKKAASKNESKDQTDEKKQELKEVKESKKDEWKGNCIAA